MSTRTYKTPEGAVCVERDADLFAAWPEGQPERWVASSPEHIATTLAEALGFDVAHDDLPDWLDTVGQEVLRDFSGQ